MRPGFEQFVHAFKNENQLSQQQRQYRVEKKLSANQNCQIQVGIYRGQQSTQKLVIKKYPLRRLYDQTQDYLNSVKTQIQVCKKLIGNAAQYTHLVRIQHVFINQLNQLGTMNLEIWMEYGEGTLWDYLITYSPNSAQNPSFAVHPICHCLMALVQLHRLGYLMHRDLKPQNIIKVTENGNTIYKLIDFSFCTKLKTSKEIVGTILYMAPEIGGGNEYDQKSDIHSLGIIFYQILKGQRFQKKKHLEFPLIEDILEILDACSKNQAKESEVYRKYKQEWHNFYNPNYQPDQTSTPIARLNIPEPNSLKLSESQKKVFQTIKKLIKGMLKQRSERFNLMDCMNVVSDLKELMKPKFKLDVEFSKHMKILGKQKEEIVNQRVDQNETMILNEENSQ